MYYVTAIHIRKHKPFQGRDAVSKDVQCSPTETRVVSGIHNVLKPLHGKHAPFQGRDAVIKDVLCSPTETRVASGVYNAIEPVHIKYAPAQGRDAVIKDVKCSPINADKNPYNTCCHKYTETRTVSGA